MNKVISRYSKEWITMFKMISSFLEKNVETYTRIEHVGSTSIPGMDAKPVIDIDIEIKSKSDFNKIKRELEDIGYLHCGDQGIEGREVFKRSGTKKSMLDEIIHHLYVCTSDSIEYKKHILFRDKLRANKSLMEEYKAIKYEILEQVGSTNRQGYVETKQNNYKNFFDRVHEE